MIQSSKEIFMDVKIEVSNITFIQSLIMTINRRTFVKNGAIIAGGVVAAPEIIMAGSLNNKPKFGVIGTGLRGRGLLDLLLRRNDVVVSAICDIDANSLSEARNLADKYGRKVKQFTGHDLAYKRLLKEDLDAVIIATPWTWHAPMAIDAMKAGKYVGCEVPLALTLDDCNEIVRVSEETGKPCMMLENVCYRRDVLAILNMVRQGLFGELLHLECGYQHDLRHVKFNNGKEPYGGGAEFGEKGFSEARWRTEHSLHKNADLYPTHGIGPVAMMTDINRKNRFLRISSFASKARGLDKYIKDIGGANHPNANLDWKLGDVVTSMIQTENGETIAIKHDTNSPRPYSLGFRVQGTEGLWMVDNRSIYLEGKSESHSWEEAKPYLEKYDHPLWKRYGKDAEGAGHGGMDFFVINAFVEAVKRETQTPIDVYDSVTWSAIVPLSEQSLASGSMPIPFPDFTGGRWVKWENNFALDDSY